jgi:uncharacterized membrane protein YidH (DUF202 family)
MKLVTRLLFALGVLLLASSASVFAQDGSTPDAADGLEVTTSSRGSLSVGRFNSVLGLGAMTAYGIRRDNRTLMIGGAIATALAYRKWSRSRKRLRSPEEKTETTIYGDLNPSEEEEYEFRKGRGETAAALALLPAYGIAKRKRTLVIIGGAATALAYRRYRQTKRESRRAEQEKLEQKKSEATLEELAPTNGDE